LPRWLSLRTSVTVRPRWTQPFFPRRGGGTTNSDSPITKTTRALNSPNSPLIVVESEHGLEVPRDVPAKEGYLAREDVLDFEAIVALEERERDSDRAEQRLISP